MCIEEWSNGKPAKTKFQAPAFNEKFNAHLMEIKKIEADPYLSTIFLKTRQTWWSNAKYFFFSSKILELIVILERNIDLKLHQVSLSSPKSQSKHLGLGLGLGLIKTFTIPSQVLIIFVDFVLL